MLIPLVLPAVFFLFWGLYKIESLLKEVIVTQRKITQKLDELSSRAT